jgi:hypothetical protein
MTLGRDTIMEPAFAARHGAVYVRLVAFAIDVDRLRELVDANDPDDAWPLGWEVFLVEMFLLGLIDPEEEAHREMLEDVLLDILDRRDDEPPLGAVLTFAVFDAVRRGELPESMGAPLRSWKEGPEELVAALEPLWAEMEVQAADLAETCLEIPIEPPLAPPTIEALEAMVEVMGTHAGPG